MATTSTTAAAGKASPTSAVTLDDATAITPAAAAVAAASAGEEDLKAFDLCVLEDTLPQKRKGLSKFYSGKARSFHSLSDAKTVDDLKKEDNLPETKRRKYLHRRDQKINPATSPFSSPVKCNS